MLRNEVGWAIGPIGISHRQALSKGFFKLWHAKHPTGWAVISPRRVGPNPTIPQAGMIGNSKNG